MKSASRRTGREEFRRFTRAIALSIAVMVVLSLVGVGFTLICSAAGLDVAWIGWGATLFATVAVVVMLLTLAAGWLVHVVVTALRQSIRAGAKTKRLAAVPVQKLFQRRGYRTWQHSDGSTVRFSFPTA